MSKTYEALTRTYETLTLRHCITKHALANMIGRTVLNMDKIYIDTGRLDCITPWDFWEGHKKKRNLGPELIICNEKLVIVLNVFSSQASTAAKNVNYVSILKSKGYIFLDADVLLNTKAKKK